MRNSLYTLHYSDSDDSLTAIPVLKPSTMTLCNIMQYSNRPDMEASHQQGDKDWLSAKGPERTSDSERIPKIKLRSAATSIPTGATTKTTTTTTTTTSCL